MSDDEERKQLYKNYRDHLLTAQLSNSESLDKAILTLSTAFLGLSLSFIKDIVNISVATHVGLLQTSWVCFVVAIISTILSLISSQIAIDTQLEYARKYYLDKIDEYLEKLNVSAKITLYLNRLSAVAFVGAIVTTVAFALWNLSK